MYICATESSVVIHMQLRNEICVALYDLVSFLYQIIGNGNSVLNFV